MIALAFRRLDGFAGDDTGASFPRSSSVSLVPKESPDTSSTSSFIVFKDSRSKIVSLHTVGSFNLLHRCNKSNIQTQHLES